MDGKPEEVPVNLIPGIGVIRARSLKKAGWDTVASLRTATLDDLRAVPGITEVKAAQILDYIQSLPVAPPKPVRRRTPAVKPPAVEAPPADAIAVIFTEPLPVEEQVAVYAIQSPRDLMQDIALNAQLLLTCEFAGKWERPFVAQLGKLITLHDKWDRFEPLGKKQSKLAMEMLQKIYRLLTETSVTEITKRKSQDRLAEELRDRRRRVRDVLES